LINDKDEGWLKLYRALLRKPIWINSTPVQKTILITLILMANHKARSWEWNGHQYEVQAGQLITSLEGIKKKAGRGISIRNVRTALHRFEKVFEFLTSEATNTGRLITIVNWSTYQSPDYEIDKPIDKRVTNDRQTGDKRVTTNKNVKNDLKNEKNEEEGRQNEKSFCPPPELRPGSKSTKHSESESDYCQRVHAFFDNLDNGYLQQLLKAYHGIDVKAEIKRMKLWLISNPNRRKKNLKRFVVNWLNHSKERNDAKIDAQQRGPSNRSTPERRAKLDALSEEF